MSSSTDATTRNLKPAASSKKRKTRVWENGRGDRHAVKQGWSWPAFIFGIFWFGVKKLWIHAVMIAAGAAVLAGVAAAAGVALDAEMGVLLPLLVLAHVVFGMYGNSMWERDLAERNYRSVNRPPRTMSGSNGEGLGVQSQQGDAGFAQTDNRSIAVADLMNSKADSAASAVTGGVGADSQPQHTTPVDITPETATHPERMQTVQTVQPQSVAQQPVQDQPAIARTVEPGLSDGDGSSSVGIVQPHNQVTPSPDPIAIPRPAGSRTNPPEPTSQTNWKPRSPMTMPELEAMFGVTPKNNSQASAQGSVTEQASNDAQLANLQTGDPQLANSQGVSQSTDPIDAFVARQAGAHADEPTASEASLDIDSSPAEETAVSHPSKETASMLEIDTNTQEEKYETIAWMEITSGDVEPELWNAVTVESDGDHDAQNNYVARRVRQLKIQQGDVVDSDTGAIPTAVQTDDNAHQVEENSEADDIHSGFINNGKDTYGNDVKTSTLNSSAATDETSATSSKTASLSASNGSENHVKHVGSSSDTIKVIETAAPKTTQTSNGAIESDDSAVNYANNGAGETASQPHVLSVSRQDVTARSRQNSAAPDAGSDAATPSPVALNSSEKEEDADAHTPVVESNGAAKPLQNGIAGTDAELPQDNLTKSADIVAAIAGDAPKTQHNGSGTTPDISEHSRRHNALNFIQNHLQRLDEDQQTISTAELKRLLWSADCELIDVDENLKIKDWDGNVIPSAGLSSISRTISYLIWTHYDESRDHV